MRHECLVLLVRLHVIHTFQHMAVTASLPHVSCLLNLSRPRVGTCQAYFPLVFAVLPIRVSFLHRLGHSCDSLLLVDIEFVRIGCFFPWNSPVT